jgi:hypothetical protein
VVEPPPLLRDYKEISSYLSCDMAHFGMAKHRDNRILNGTEAGASRQHHDRFQRGGQLPRHDRPWANAETNETGCH